MSEIAQLTSTNFESDAVSTPGLTAVRFWAGWCNPCTMSKPAYTAVADAFEGKVNFGAVDIDTAPELAQRYQVKSVPTIVLLKNGKPVDSFSGMLPQSELAAKITQHI